MCVWQLYPGSWRDVVADEVIKTLVEWFMVSRHHGSFWEHRAVLVGL
jgi:hypothetical protein